MKIATKISGLFVIYKKKSQKVSTNIIKCEKRNMGAAMTLE